MPTRKSSLRKRIIAYLCKVAEGDVAQITHEQIAQAVKSPRPNVTRSMRAMQAQGLIDMRPMKCTLVTLKREKLDGYQAPL